MEKRVPRKTDFKDVLANAASSFDKSHEHVRDEWYILKSHSQRDDYDGGWEVTWKEEYGPFESRDLADEDLQYLNSKSPLTVPAKYKIARKRHYMFTPSPYPVAYWS